MSPFHVVFHIGVLATNRHLDSIAVLFIERVAYALDRFDLFFELSASCSRKMYVNVALSHTPSIETRW